MAARLDRTAILERKHTMQQNATDRDLTHAPHHTRVRESVRRQTALAFLAFESAREQTPALDIETFLRSSNLPFAICEYIRSQNARGQADSE
jgi:hypothetical protein